METEKKGKVKIVFINSTCHCKQKVAHLDVLRKTHSYFCNKYSHGRFDQIIHKFSQPLPNNTDMHIKLIIS